VRAQTEASGASDLMFPCEESPEACAQCRSNLEAGGTPVALLDSQCGLAGSSADATEYSDIDFSTLVAQVTGIECDTYYDRFDILLSEESGTEDDRDFAYVEGICYQPPLDLFRQSVLEGSEGTPFHPDLPVVRDTIDFATGLDEETVRLGAVLQGNDICEVGVEPEEDGAFDLDELQSRNDAVEALLDCARWYELAVQCDFPSLLVLVNFENTDYEVYDLSEQDAVSLQFPDERPEVVRSLIAYAQWSKWWSAQQGDLRTRIASLDGLSREITRDRRALCEP
jgi:hypothetical protein